MKRLHSRQNARRAGWPAVLLCLVVAGLVAAPAQAQSPAAPGLNPPGKNTRVSYKAVVDVALQVDVETTFESIQKCVPGENGSVSYSFRYESAGGGKKPAPVQIETINGVGGTPKPARGVKGEAVERGTPGPWQFSLDRCIDGSPAELPKDVTAPQCKTLKGRSAVSLATDLNTGEGDDLTPLGYGGGMAVNRLGGGTQNPSCLRLFQRIDSADGIVDFELGAPAFYVRIKQLSKVLLNAAGKKGVGYANFKVSGPCYAMGSSSAATRAALTGDPIARRLVNNVGPTFGSARYEKCMVDGSGVLTVRRTGKVTRLKF